MNTENILDRFFAKLMLQVLVVISQKFCCRREAWAMQELFIKKEKKRKKELRKNGQVSEIFKTMGT